MSQNLGQLHHPQIVFVGTPMSVRDCAYSDIVTVQYRNDSNINFLSSVKRRKNGV